ncbi:hypothetical protein ACHAWO_005686 [Cyclotella atomus]|uniref:C2H2-type domain-containing protein n=1 Tax=Cyclotella atomus TaxID=382360 RepID=A0ABD3QJY4_9STRA
MDEIAAAAEIMVPALPEGDIEAAVAAAVNDAAMSEVAAQVVADPPKQKRVHRAKALSPKQAVTKFWSRGIYVIANEDLDIDANETSDEVRGSKYIIRCRCSPTCKTSFAGWDAYAYNRHFSYKKHVKWEQLRTELGWDESEAYREFVKFIEMTLDDDDEEEEYEEPPKKRGRKPKNHASAPLPKLKKSKRISRSEERRQQEMHYMNLWRETRAELKVMRQQLKVETIQESIDELNVDIAGLKRKKDEWAKLLGIQGAEV